MSLVKLDITHNVLPQRFAEIRFELSLTIKDLKERLHKHTGTLPESMKVQLLDLEGTHLCNLDDDDLQLGFFGVENDMTLHVIDVNPSSQVIDLNDVSKVEKFELSEEQYSKRQDSFRKWKQNNTTCCTSCTSCSKPAPKDYTEALSKIEVGNRCEVQLGAKRGTVRYVGSVNGDGPFVGVELDEPLGKNDGSVKGVEYFSCAAKYGLFVRPDKLNMGDFPKFDDSDLSD
ncbi:hypothetical protein GEMRC1_001958 [Eukaryota sp. GEM-RC1]